MESMTQLVLDLLTVGFLIFGLFFMMVAGLGLLRMPDVYHRMHAASKGVTLGISGMLVAGALALSTVEGSSAFRISTTVAMVILFQFIANPVGAHMLAKAAHLDGAPRWKKTLSDDIESTSPDAGQAG